MKLLTLYIGSWLIQNGETTKGKYIVPLMNTLDLKADGAVILAFSSDKRMKPSSTAFLEELGISLQSKYDFSKDRLKILPHVVNMNGKRYGEETDSLGLLQFLGDSGEAVSINLDNFLLQCPPFNMADGTSNQEPLCYAGIFDTMTEDYCQVKFLWKDSKWEDHISLSSILNGTVSGSALFQPTPEYIQNLLVDEKQTAYPVFTQYYVFPQLQLEKSGVGHYGSEGAVRTEESLIGLIERTPQVEISGESNSGKTTLLKRLFLILSKKYVVLFFRITDISQKKLSNAIRDTFQAIYGSEPEKFEAFQQMDRSSKIILIDDSDKIKRDYLKKLAKDLNQQFAHVILSGNRIFFHISNQLDSQMSSNVYKQQLAISKFYADRRYKLINKIVQIYQNKLGIKDVDKFAQKIEDELCMQNLSFKLDPDFIVKFTSYCCTHNNDLQALHDNVFSKVFEASIEMEIMPNLTTENVGQIQMVLSEVAYYIHFHECYIVEKEKIASVVAAYADEYMEHICLDRFLEITMAARLLVPKGNGTEFSFRNKDYLAYFAAKAVSRHFNEQTESAEKDLRSIVQYSFRAINSRILKYIAYTTENIRVIQLLLEQAIDSVEGWDTFSIEKKQLRFLDGMVEDISIKRLEANANAKQKELKSKMEREREQEQCESKGTETDSIGVIETVDFYSHDADEIFEINNQIMRALLQVEVLASVLPTFSYLISKDIKLKLIRSLYDLPNKIFYVWGTAMDEYIADFPNELQRQDPSMKKEDALEEARIIRIFMQNISLHLLLDLYFTIARKAAVPGTIVNLIEQGNGNPDDSNRVIQRLMFFEQVDKCSDFISTAIKWYKSTNSPFARNALRIMVQHILTWSSNLTAPQRHQLMDVFRFEKGNKYFLMDSAQNPERRV